MIETIHKIRAHVEQGIFCKISDDEDVVKLQQTKPKLYAMVTSSQCDKMMLEKLIDLQKKIANGSLSQGEADETFGGVAANKYVMPLVE